MTNVDVVVAGAGIWGSTLARRFAEKGMRTLVLERRSAVGGNVRCETDPESGIEVHTYGSHIFHTSIPEVWQFVNRFVTFNGYQHKVLARHKGKTYFLPLGLALINGFFGTELKPSEVPGFMADEAHSSRLFDAFFRGYTSKQWGRSPEDIDPSIIKRVPVRASYDVNYFNDCNQGIPLGGYNSLFDRLLDHPLITVKCSQRVCFKGGAFMVGPDALPNIPVYYSGPIDELFGYKFGELPWRTLRFETEKMNIADYQGTSVVNYTDAEVPYTRIHEFKHYHPEQKDVMALEKTIVMREYSAAWKRGDEPYYPVDNAASRLLLEAYQAEAAKIKNLVVGGRLGAYRYFDMDKSIAAALSIEI
ncbi:MAG: NAD(P)-binding protein [Kiritimatiellae bacterium]|nr:NAD(P)-binding protein [Kiritimatiellia bacterium]